MDNVICYLKNFEKICVLIFFFEEKKVHTFQVSGHCDVAGGNQHFE